jgi:Arc/MetJ-type ribon-helix-helix transcriptional regulator
VGRSKIAITLDEGSVREIDRLVSEGRYPNRSQAIQAAVDDRLAHLSRSRLALECAKLNPEFEQALADEGISAELDEWPEY